MEIWQVLFPYACAFLRSLGLVLTAPIFGSRYVPGQIKVFLSTALSLVVWPKAFPANSLHPLSMGLSFCTELALGAIMGFSASLIMASLEVAGHVVDMSMGLGLAGTVDPMFGSSVPLAGMFKGMAVTLIILSLDGHHTFIRAVRESFELMPPGFSSVPEAWAVLNIQAAVGVFKTGLALAAPVWAVSLVVDVALGVVARSVPQINMFVVGIPLKTIAGLVTLLAAFSFYDVLAKDLLRSMKTLLDSLLRVVVP